MKKNIIAVDIGGTTTSVSLVDSGLNFIEKYEFFTPQKRNIFKYLNFVRICWKRLILPENFLSRINFLLRIIFLYF